MGFIAARLGNSENKKRFIEQQSIDYPDFSSWRVHTDILALQRKIHEDSVKLRTVFDKQERLAALRQELSQMLIEQEYFNQYVQEKNIYIAKINPILYSGKLNFSYTFSVAELFPETI